MDPLKVRIIATIIFLLIAACAIATNTGCSDGPRLKRIEYNINGDWKRCDLLGTFECGVHLRCGMEEYECMGNLQSRWVDR